MERNVHEITHVTRAARAFGAFRIAFDELKTHYRSVVLNPRYQRDAHQKEAHKREVAFPYPKSFINSDGATTSFTYLERPDPTKLNFIATFGQSKVFIKFTEQYSKAAHQHCATAGVAPQLYGVTPLPAGWLMVVMAYLEPSMYRTLELQDEGSAGLVKEVDRVVSVLHDGGFVHGDIRTINMMVHEEQDSSKKEVLLLDFDWAGAEGTVKYPLDVDGLNIKRHDGASGGAVIRKEHDWFMVKHLFM